MASKTQSNPADRPVNYLTHQTSLWSMLKTIIAANGNAAVQASLAMEGAVSACNRITGLAHNEVSVPEAQQNVRLQEENIELQKLLK